MQKIGMLLLALLLALLILLFTLRIQDSSCLQEVGVNLLLCFLNQDPGLCNRLKVLHHLALDNVHLPLALMLSHVEIKDRVRVQLIPQRVVQHQLVDHVAE